MSSAFRCKQETCGAVGNDLLCSLCLGTRSNALELLQERFGHTMGKLAGSFNKRFWLLDSAVNTVLEMIVVITAQAGRNFDNHLLQPFYGKGSLDDIIYLSVQLCLENHQ